MEKSENKVINAELMVNGRNIELNQFVNDILGNGILGLIKPLRDVEDAETVTISLKIKK